MSFTYFLFFFYIIIFFFTNVGNSIKIKTIIYIKSVFLDNFLEKNNTRKEISPISIECLSKVVYLFFYNNIVEDKSVQR